MLRWAKRHERTIAGILLQLFANAFLFDSLVDVIFPGDTAHSPFRGVRANALMQG